MRPLRPVRPSSVDRLWYRYQLKAIVDELRMWTVKHLLPAITGYFPSPLAMDAKMPARVREILDERIRVFGPMSKRAEKLAVQLVTRSLKTVDDRLANSVRASLGVNVEPFLSKDGRIRQVMGEKLLQNIDLIQSIPAQHFQDVANAVAETFERGGRISDLAEKIEHITEVEDTRAATIARDQMGKLNAAFNQVRQTDLGVKYYGWVCTHINTREEHLAMETKDVGYGPGVFSWEEEGPLEGTIDGEPCHPGEDINCNCYALPYVNLEALADELDSIKRAA